ncbi:MAG: AI-2E family transporter [Candidatus Merdivicinus sp.]|jgi:predicted PurR-regulated permease PerM
MNQPKRWPWKWILVGGIALLLVQHPALGWEILCRVGSALLPFGLGLGIAFILNVPLSFLEERLFPHRRIGRGITLAAAWLLTAGVIAVLLFLLLPQLQKSGQKLWDQLPRYLDQSGAFAARYAQRMGPLSGIAERMTEAFPQWLDSLPKNGPDMVQSTVDAASHFMEGVINFAAGAVFSVYLLAKKEHLCACCKKVLYAYLPREKADNFIRIGELAARTFRNFVTGQLTEAFLLGAMCFLGMSIFQMPYAPLISAIIGVTALIPIFGAFFGAAAGALILLMERPLLALWFLIFILVLQQLENSFLYPRIVGESIGLPGIWVLLAVTAGGSLFGIAGILIGIPVTAVLYSILREKVEDRLRSRGFCPADSPKNLSHQK